MNLAGLLSAESVAIIGAAENRHYPKSIMMNMLRLGFPRERLFPINPKYSMVLEIPCYPSLDQLPVNPDLVVIATRKDTVPDLLDQAVQGGAKAALVLADGFAEQGDEGKRLQLQLAEQARHADIAILGPNTLGFVVPSNGLGVWAGGEFPGQVIAGGIAMCFQSSGMLNLVLGLVCDRHLGLRAAVSVGNEAVLDIADFIEQFADDLETKVITVFLETSIRPAKLVSALQKAQAAGKPVIMLKVGRSERARRNAVAHTGRMASSGKAWDAMLERLGVVLVKDLDELLETASLFQHRGALTPQGGVGLCTISGGDCSLLSDLAEQLNVPLPDVEPHTKKILVEALEKPTLLGNPLDCENLRREDPTKFDRLIDAFCNDPGLELIAYRMNLAKQPSSSLITMYDDLLEKARKAGKMPVVLTRAFEPLDSEWFRYFEKQGVAFLPSYRTALSAIHHLFAWVRRNSDALKDSSAPGAVPEHADHTESATKVLSWTETQEWLKQAGISYVPARLTATAEEAGDAADELGYPVVAKLASPDLPHKSEMNAVRLRLQSREEVVAACEDMLQTVRYRQPDADINGFEIQSMKTGGTEMILGMTTDASLGPILLVGMGGIFTEVMEDVVLAVPPLSGKEALQLVDRLKGAPMLKGVRGKPPADRAALADTIASFSRFVVEKKHEIVEMDVNPLLVMSEGMGAIAVDGLITKRTTR